MNPTWLMQRLKEPKGYTNPYGDVNNEIPPQHLDELELEDNIDKVVSPDYMGAAEYEWGAYGKCIDEMYDEGVHKKTISIYPDTCMKPVNIVFCTKHLTSEIKDDGIQRPLKLSNDIIEQVRNLYLNVSSEYHKTGRYINISKNDYGSFYRALQDYENSKYIGWLNIKEHYAIFLNGDRTKHFMDHINAVHGQRAEYYDQITKEGVINHLKQLHKEGK